MNASEHRYQKVLQRLEARGNYEVSAQPRDISKLAGIQTLLSDLGNPHQSCTVIHIAGTTGKGLTAAMIAAILQKEGLSTGLYSSPHIADIRERIILNGQWISQTAFAQSAERVLNQAESYKGRVYVSYFDILTATAFMAFREAKMEYIVLETGLGGKADSTNVTDKALNVLTSIGYDHIHVLGNSLQSIAQEKLGIVRQGTPTVLASQLDELKPWLVEQLRALKSPLILAEQLSIKKEKERFQFQWPDGSVDGLALGKQQSTLPYLECFKTALMAAHALYPAAAPHQRLSWIEAAAGVALPGRLQYFENILWQPESPPFKTLIFDGGHNATALAALSAQLKIWEIEGYILVLGFAADKLIAPLKEPLQALCQTASRLIATQANSSRAASPEEVVRFVVSAHKGQKTPAMECFATSQEVLAHLSSHPKDPIVLAGSFYLIGEFYQALNLPLVPFK